MVIIRVTCFGVLKNLPSVHVTHLGALQILTINRNDAITALTDKFLWWRRSVLSEGYETSLYGIKLQNIRLFIHTAVRTSCRAQQGTLTGILRYTDDWKTKRISSLQVMISPVVPIRLSQVELTVWQNYVQTSTAHLAQHPLSRFSSTQTAYFEESNKILFSVTA